MLGVLNFKPFSKVSLLKEAKKCTCLSGFISYKQGILMFTLFNCTQFTLEFFKVHYLDIVCVKD